MTLIDMLKIAGQYCLPKHAISRLVGKLAAAEAGTLTTKLIRLFINRFGIDMSEAEFEDPAHYPSFNAFFTRSLRPGVRPLPQEPHALASPADGSLSQFGAIEDGRLFQAKGLDYALEDLVASADWARRFRGGSFATIYLSPRDYHRVHMPAAGKLREMIQVPGRLFSVNRATASLVLSYRIDCGTLPKKSNAAT